MVRGVGALVVYGGVWLSVRDQHPYAYPTAWAIPGGVAFGLANTVATVAVARRAMAGVSGRTKLRRADMITITVIMIAVIVVMAVLARNGVSDRIVYGLYPAAVPLIVGGLSWAGIMAARANWREFFTAPAVAVVGAISLLAGPAGAWAVAGVGICVVLLGSAAAVARRQRS